MDVWEWLRSCRICNKPHEWSWRCSKPDHPNHGQYGMCEGGTWADPVDGHPYERRLRFDLASLQAEYEQARGGA